jgi:Methyltransferase FkbM domain
MNETDRRDASAQIPMRSQIKRLVREVARIGYRAVRPIVRPLAYRTRTFFTAEIRQDVLNEIRQTHAVAMSVLVQTAQSVQHELLVSAHQFHDASSREAQALVAGTHKSVQFARESVREDMFRTHAATSVELRAESDQVALAIEKVAEMFRAQASSLHSVAIESDAFSRLDRSAKLASGRRAAVQCGEDVLLVKSESGYVFCAESDRDTLASLLDTGDLNKGTRLITQRLLVPGDVFVDVGAHIGLDTLAAAHVLRRGGQIFAFESSESNRFLLAKSVAMNGFAGMVDVRELDLSNVSLDSLLAENRKISLMKIDANGAVVDVINGARSLITANPEIALIVKVSKLDGSFDRVISQARGLVLVFCAIDSTTGELVDTAIDSIGEHDHVDLLLARRESGAWSKLGVKHD